MLVSLARGLSEHGMNVAFVTYGADTEPFTHQGITIYPVFNEQDGIRGIRNIHPRLTRLYSVLKKINAPVYTQMGAGIETAMTCLVARLFLRKRMVYCVASDSDCMTSTPLVYSAIEANLYKWGLKFANERISQTLSQKAMLQDHFALASVTIPMPHIQLAPAALTKATDEPQEIEILWVGRPVPGKRLEMLIDVADLHPSIQFHVVGADNNDSTYSRSVSERARQAENIKVHGKASESKLQSLYQSCSILACTSELEGFPATFMEAWSYGKPVITTFDPDGIVAQYNLGRVCDTAESFSRELSGLIAEPDEYKSLSAECQQYYLKNFTTDAVIPSFIAAFEG
jgi:glycosyltransferase involved in cell wall biosynthesis